MDKIVLIDGNSLFNRAFYAMPVFTTQDGTPTNAIFGFVKLLFKIFNDVKPQYVAVAFDMKAPTFRHKMYEGYKATRKPMPEELAVQVEPLKNLLKAMKIATYEAEGIEADDILGSLSKKFNVQSYIYTGDRDSYQLVDEHTDVMFTKRGVSDILHLDLANFKAETGLNPSQIVDLKSLMGDESDNIPGVAGIGKKTAETLLAKYSTLDGIYAHLDEIGGATAKKLAEGRETAYLSYTLAKINRDCEVDLQLEDCVVPKKFSGEVRKIFADLDFKSLLGLDIFEGETVTPNQKAYPEKVVLKSADEILSIISANQTFTVDVGEFGAEMYVDGKEYEFAVSDNLLEGLTAEDFINILRAIFENPENSVTAFDFKQTKHLLAKFGISAECKFEDVAITGYICDNSVLGEDIKGVCEKFGYDFNFRAFAMTELFNEFLMRLDTEDMMSLYDEIEKPLVNVLFDMENTGVKVSLARLAELSKRFHDLADDYRLKIYKGCDCEFNLNSPAQLADVLYNKLGITEVMKKKSGKFSTSAEVLEKLVDRHPVIADILKFRLYQKLASTYAEGLKPLIDRQTGLVHTTYRQTLTTTGRLSSVNPNLQNIPIREEEGRELRKIFVPREEGNVFIDADYSQIELRLLAHLSNCKELIEAYNAGADIHAATASQVFGVKPEEVTPKMRREAKAVNFGIIYGISDFGLAKNLNIPVSTARDYISTYFEKYPSVKCFMNANVEFARQYGYVCTIMGRKRVIPEISSPNFNIRQFGERAAMNMPLQGSSADIIKIAMINVFNALNAEGLKTKMILQVHDELVLEAPENEAERAAAILKREMENAIRLKVPLTVDVHIGRDWYEAK